MQEAGPVWTGSWTAGCWLPAAAAGQSSGKRAVARRGLVAPVTGEQTGVEEIGERLVGLIGLHLLHELGSWRTGWSLRDVLPVLPVVGSAELVKDD